MKLHSIFSGCLFLLILVYPLTSCTHEPYNLDDLDAVCFDTEVLPILKTSCGIAGCHDGSEEHFTASGYSSVMDLVKPGDPRGSQLYRVITDIRSDDMMPPHNPLTERQRNIIQVWIAQGAKETSCVADTGGNNVDSVCFVQDILPFIMSGCGTTGCHDQITAEEDYVFTDYTGIMEGIRPFSPGNSEIYKAVTESGDDIMPPPPRSPLTSEQIAALRGWIEDGALNSDCPETACDTTGMISFAAQVDPLLRNTCTGCHNSTVANANVNLAGYNNVVLQTNNVRDGMPVMLGSLKRLSGFIAMPPTYNLDACSIALIEKWINQGSENN